MGVLYLYPWLCDQFPQAVRHFRSSTYTHPIDALYIDGNPLLHAACQEVFCYGQGKSVIDRYASLSFDQKRLRVFEMIFEKLLHLTSIVVPRKILYIAFDGVPPVSKQYQQRQRRFVAAKDASRKFDSNALTTGTEFQHELTKYLNFAIRREMNRTSSKWRNLKVYFSSHTVPGEGEHKLLQFIRSLQIKDRNEMSQCFVGNDGDLIFLTLASQVPNIFLLREDTNTIDYYYLVDMGLIRSRLPSKLNQLYGIESRTRKTDDVVADFVLAGFFVGNDFLPKVKCFYKLPDGMATMMETYSMTTEGGMYDHVTIFDSRTKKHRINIKGFSKFVSDLALSEPHLLYQQSFIIPREERFTDVVLKRCVSAENKTVDMRRYRRAYYEHAGIKLDEVDKLCENYLRGLDFVFRYYMDALPAWRYYYPCHYAPLLCDFSKYLNRLPENFEMQHTLDSPPPPFVQLLCVLPPKSKQLLPEPFHFLFEDEKKSVLLQKGYYPDKFEVDYMGKTKEHEGIVLLPFVDIQLVMSAYEPIFETLQYKYVRNGVGKVGVFSVDNKMKAKFKSEYGTIEDLQIQKVEI